MPNFYRCGAAICLMAMVAPIYPAAADQVLTRSCVTRDLAILTLIEKQGEAQSQQASVLGDAFIDVLDARRACRDGRTKEGLTIYDRVGAQLTGAERWATLHSDP
jgi:hypothetical protein